jgi:hypothetical protein
MRERKGGDKSRRACSDYGGVMHWAGRGDAILPRRFDSGDPEAFCGQVSVSIRKTKQKYDTRSREA